MNDFTADSPTLHTDILHGPHRPDLLQDEVLADLLEATARRCPDQIALIDGERKLTYAEVDALASLAASRLVAAGVRPGDIVGLWLPRGANLLLTQAAIAKAGAAWLPVDEDTPVERLQVCLDDANGAGIVSCAQFAPRLADAGVTRPVWTAESLLAPRAAGEVLTTTAASTPQTVSTSAVATRAQNMK